MHHLAGMHIQVPWQDLSQRIWGPSRRVPRPPSPLETLLLPDAQEDAKLQVGPKQVFWERGLRREEQMALLSRAVIRP